MTAEILVPCPVCERQIDVQPLHSGDQVSCTSCGALLLMEHGNGFSRFYVIAVLPIPPTTDKDTPPAT